MTDGIIQQAISNTIKDLLVYSNPTDPAVLRVKKLQQELIEKIKQNQFDYRYHGLPTPVIHIKKLIGDNND